MPVDDLGALEYELRRSTANLDFVTDDSQPVRLTFSPDAIALTGMICRRSISLTFGITRLRRLAR